MQEQDVVPALFSLALLASLVGGIIGLVAPSIYRFGRPERPSRKRIAAISLGLFIASFIGLAITVPEPTAEEKAAHVAAAAKAQAASPDAAVISTTEGHNIRRIKRSVTVRLSREISYSELVALGKSIRDQDSNYERVFIEYLLPGMRENAGAWAITHWTPNLEAKILGRDQVPSPTTAVAPRDTAGEPRKLTPTTDASDGGEATCVPTHQTTGWEFISNNAVRLGDAYATERMPQAVFAFARPVVRKQIAGKNKGRYLLSLIGQNEIMQLEPLFDFCTPAEKLDDEGDLWRVVFAKYGEKEF